MLNRLATLIAIIGPLAAALLWAQSHFASATDLRRVEQQTVQTIQAIRAQIITDQLNDLEAKKQMNPQGYTKYDAIRQKDLERQWEAIKDD